MCKRESWPDARRSCWLILIAIPPSKHRTMRRARFWKRLRKLSHTMNKKHLSNLSIKIFADGANYRDLVQLSRQPWIRGFTTNPSLLRKAGVNDYAAFARDVLRVIR